MNGAKPLITKAHTFSSAISKAAHSNRFSCVGCITPCFAAHHLVCLVHTHMHTLTHTHPSAGSDDDNCYYNNRIIVFPFSMCVLCCLYDAHLTVNQPHGSEATSDSIQGGMVAEVYSALRIMHSQLITKARSCATLGVCLANYCATRGGTASGCIYWFSWLIGEINVYVNIII